MDTDAIMREMQASFRIEAEELVTDLEESLLQLESDNGNSTLIDRVFRSLHTLKGSGSSAGFLKLAAFLHIFEDAFNLAREGKLDVTQELIDLSLKTVDQITAFVSEAPSNEFDRQAIENDPILVDLKKIMPTSSSAHATELDSEDQSSQREIGIYSISFKPFDSFMEFGNDPISVIDEIRTLGHASIDAHSNIPDVETFEAEKTYLSWQIELVSESSLEDVEEVFSFVEMDADISVERTARKIDETSNTPGLFDANTLDDFETESLALISSIQDAIIRCREDFTPEDHWVKIERSYHSFKGNSGILLSSASSPVKDTHPLNKLVTLSEAGERFSRESLSTPELLNNESRLTTVETLSNTLKEIYRSFILGYVAAEIDEGILSQLGLDPSVFKSTKVDAAPPQNLSPQEEAFQNIFAQSIAMLEGSCAKLDDDSFDKEIPIIQRGIANILRASKSAAKPSVTAICQTYQDQSETQKSEGPEAIKTLLTAQLEALKTAANSEALPEQTSPTPSVKAANVPASKPVTEQKTKSSLRVDEDKIDRLMRAIGELLVARGAFPIIAKNVLDEHGLTSVAQELREAGGNVSRLADELQSAVMSIRMRSLQALFQRFPRMIRDVSKSLGKEINFVISGEETELDKSMVDQLGDPLVHILRNALDHGIETAEERAQTTKDPVATISLKAITEGSTVAIKIQDDGRGLNPEKLKKKAIEKGLISQAEADIMPEHIAYELIMRPGFSTAETVTDLSGRGVGMDVVANNIRKLHGAIEIDSEFGTGTTITLRLPTSLLVSEAILLKSGEEEYLVPMENVASLEKLPLANVRQHAGTRMITVRNEVVNLVDLRELLSTPRESDELPDYLNVALIKTLDGQLGLIVDKFVSQEEIVVKPLSGELSGVKLFAGVSIMGDGRVVPVFDPREIHNFYLKNARQLASEVLQS